MATVDRTRQYLSAYRAAIIGGIVGAALVTTAGVTIDRSPPSKPRIVSDGHTITPPPVTVTTTVTATPMGTPSPSETPSPPMLPSQLPSSIPPSISVTPTPSATPTLTPSPTPTPRNHANGLKSPWCVIAVDHQGQVIKRPCKETP